MMKAHHLIGSFETDRPLLSIITINKNNASGLKRTVASLLPLQHDRTIECLFVDGLSTDESIALASSFYRPTQLVSEPDAGIYQAMNKGLALASGDWVVWLNSGDEWIAASWPSLKDLLLKTKASILCAASAVIDHRTGACIRINQARLSDLPWGMLNHSSMIIRRETILQYQGYDETYRISADRKLLVGLYLNHELISLSELCLTRFWLGGLSDKRLMLRAVENLRVDLDLGLISRRSYLYGLFRQVIFLCLVRPVVLLLRHGLSRIGIRLPPLGAYAGPLGELRRDAFANKIRP